MKFKQLNKKEILSFEYNLFATQEILLKIIEDTTDDTIKSKAEKIHVALYDFTYMLEVERNKIN